MDVNNQSGSAPVAQSNVPAPAQSSDSTGEVIRFVTLESPSDSSQSTPEMAPQAIHLSEEGETSHTLVPNPGAPNRIRT